MNPPHGPPSPASPPNASSQVDWHALERLRRAFLDGTAGARDYWNDEVTLASYDATFAQRIGWKWDFVLEDLRQRGWTPPAGGLADWGCGTGIATRAFLDHFGTTAVHTARFIDRSQQATAFASRRAAAKYPNLSVEQGAIETAPEIVLLSHVLTELNPVQSGKLVAWLSTATAILWVEPGTYEASLALIAVRERLRSTFHPVAPCLHAGTCGILDPANERHWCHHFASPPPGVFSDPFWGRFAALLDIDLRSVPLSYLVLDRRPPLPPPPGAVRVLGRPRLDKAFARIHGCDASGVRERRLERRASPETWQAIRKGRSPSLMTIKASAL